MKSTKELEDFRSQSVDGLRKVIRDKEEELMKLQFRHAGGQLEQWANLRTIKRSIARANFVVGEKQRAEANA